MTPGRFLGLYEAKLVDKSLSFMNTPQAWSSITESWDLPEALLLSTVEDQLLASIYVMQPLGVEAPRYLQIWEIIKRFLSLQAGAGAGGGQVYCAAVVGEQEGEGDDVFEWRDAGEHNVLGFEANLSGHKTIGKMEFVLLRAPANRQLPIKDGLDMVLQGATPLLVGEVKPAEYFDDHIWQPLSFVVELMEKSSDPPESMWVFLTDAAKWEFVRVDRVRSSITEEGGDEGGASAAGAMAAGDPVAGAASAGSRYNFTRLLTVLHNIIFPGQQLADLPDRIARSRQALEAQAGKWVKIAQAKAQDDVEKLKADYAKVMADNEKLREIIAKMEAEREAGQKQAV